MHQLLDIREDYARDVHMHYTGSVWLDKEDNEFMLIRDVEEARDKCIVLHYTNSKKEPHTKKVALSDLYGRFSAVQLQDGFINLNGYCLLTERIIDGKYKKVTTLNNTIVHPLGAAFSRVNEKRTKRELDSYVCMKALLNVYYSFDDALQKLRSGSMFSAALSSSIAMLKQPVKDGEDRVHLTYFDVYIGEVVDGQVKFEDESVRELVIDSLKELGYAA